MSETKIIKLGCPECGQSVFKHYAVQQPNRIEGSGFHNSFFYTVEECACCGWKSAPTEEQEARRYAGVAFIIASLPQDRRQAYLEEHGYKAFTEIQSSASTGKEEPMR